MKKHEFIKLVKAVVSFVVLVGIYVLINKWDEVKHFIRITFFR